MLTCINTFKYFLGLVLFVLSLKKDYYKVQFSLVRNILFVNPFNPSQFIFMWVLILLTFSTQNELFGNENKSNDHTQHLSKMKHKILPICWQGNYRDSLGEFPNIKV